MHHHVVVGAECVVIVGREGLLVSLDQPFIGAEIFERHADFIAVGAARLLDREREKMHRVIGVRRADGREDVRRAFDLRKLLLQFSNDLLAGRALVAEEAVGLHELRVARGGTREFGEASARNAPVGNDRNLPAHAVARLHDLRAGGGVADENEHVSAGLLQSRELRDEIDVVVLEFLDAGDLDALVLFGGGLQALFVGFAPGIVDEDEAGFLGAELLGVLEKTHVDERVDGGDAEHIIRIRAVMGDRGAGSPDADERHFFLVRDGHDRERHRRVETAEESRDLFLEDQFARSDQALGRVGFVVALDELELAAAEQAALGVDLVDCDLQAAGHGFARLRRRARERRDLADLDRIGGETRGCKKERGGDGGPPRPTGITSVAKEIHCDLPDVPMRQFLLVVAFRSFVFLSSVQFERIDCKRTETFLTEVRKYLHRYLICQAICPGGAARFTGNIRGKVRL